MDQQLFLAQCRENHEGRNFASYLADLLGVNPDAAYRRIRGTTPLTYPEMQKICNHFNLSFDNAVNYQGKSHPFEFTTMFDENGFDMLTYIRDVVDQLRAFRKDPQSSMTVVAMDLPYFRQFGYSHLLRFKLFYWQRSILNLEEHRHRKFDPTLCDEAIEEAMKEVYALYHEFDSTEIWTPETMDSTLKQIQYGVDSGFFNSHEDALQVCDDLENLLTKLEREALVAKKSLASDIDAPSGKFEMYQSDILLGTNTVQVKCQDETYTYVGFNSFNSLMSKSPTFSEECSLWIGQIRSKSTLLSDVSEKLRYMFFQGLRAKISTLRNLIIENGQGN